MAQLLVWLHDHAFWTIRSEMMFDNPDVIVAEFVSQHGLPDFLIEDLLIADVLQAEVHHDPDDPKFPDLVPVSYWRSRIPVAGSNQTNSIPANPAGEYHHGWSDDGWREGAIPEPAGQQDWHRVAFAATPPGAANPHDLNSERTLAVPAGYQGGCQGTRQ